MRKKVKCPLMEDKEIDSTVCFDIHGVVDFDDPDRFAPKEIFRYPDFREICRRCAHHRFE